MQRANQEAQPQRPHNVYATAAPFLRQIKKPIMQYEFCLQMQYLTKQVSKILSCICLKHGVYLDVNNNNH